MYLYIQYVSNILSYMFEKRGLNTQKKEVQFAPLFCILFPSPND